MKEKFRIMVLGLGNHGAGWADIVKGQAHKNIEIAALVDRDQDCLKKIRHDVPKYTDLDTALREQSPDAVINVTAPNAHVQINKMLLQKGIAVLCEKPVSEEKEEAEQFLLHCENEGYYCMIAENYRYREVIRRAAGCIRDGQIGVIRRVRCNFAHYHPDYSSFYHGALRHPLLSDVSVHHLDLVRYLTGKEPVRVWCREWPAPDTWYGERKATALLYADMTEGVLFEYSGTLASFVSATDWFGDWEIEGSLGTLKISGTTLLILRDDMEIDSSIFKVEDVFEDTRIPVLEEFRSAVIKNRPAETDIRDNIKTFRFMNRAAESAELGRELEVFL